MKFVNKYSIIAAVAAVAAVITGAYVYNQITSVAYYTVTNLTGKAFSKYQDQLSNKTGSDAGEIYKIWMPLNKGMRLVPGVTVKTETDSSLDLRLDDGMAFRIKEATIIKISEDPNGRSPVQAMLSKGKILANLVASKLTRISGGGTYKLRVDTNNAVCGIRGTVFSVAYQPTAITTTVAVLEGVADVFKSGELNENADGPGSGTKVTDLKKVIIPKQTDGLQDLSPEERQELREVRELKIETSILERLPQIKEFIDDYIFNSVVGKEYVSIARYEMSGIANGAIAKAIKDGKLMNSLQDMELDKGTYNDPWGTIYLYLKIDATKAILISAGPDRIFHTPDDIYRGFVYDYIPLR